jgi:hypothetical protein
LLPVSGAAAVTATKAFFLSQRNLGDWVPSRQQEESDLVLFQNIGAPLLKGAPHALL